MLLSGVVDPDYRPVRVSLDLSELTSSETVLTGLLEDRSPALGVLAQIEVLASSWSNSDKSRETDIA